ncbi:MAG TPA: diguanylate cyclase, partial [Acidimicrobiales bacterium]|nr:diguanylate cyclase [Acidimicrobiales bacterium]
MAKRASPAEDRRSAPADGAGQQAGMLFAFVGVLGLVSDCLPGTPGRGHLLPVLLNVANLTIGVTAWVLPWSRLPSQSRLVLPLLAFTSVALYNAVGALPVATIGVWYVLVFVWTGMWYTPRTAFAFGPIALMSYLVPFAFGAPRTGDALTAVVMVVPVAVFVGVVLARKTAAALARRLAEDRLATIVDGAPIAMVAFDTQGRVTYSQASKALSRTGPGAHPYGTGADLIGRSVFDVLGDFPGTVARVKRALAGEEVTAEVQVIDKFLDVHYRPFYDTTGAVAGATCVGVDVTDRVTAQRQRQRLEVQALADSQRQARTDDLTDLANRRGLYERLEVLLAGETEGSGFALLLLDLDRFKEVNDAMG